MLKKLLLPILILFLAPGCPQRGRPAPRPGDYCPPEQTARVHVPPDAAAPLTQPLPATPNWRPVTGRMVILDAGHGGKDDGTAHFGLREKDINLDLAARTAATLRAMGVTVHMTRQADVFVPLPERSAFANRYPNAILVSIHVNASEGTPGATGIETFVLTQEFTDAERGRTAGSRFRMDGADPAQNRTALASLAASCRAKGPALADTLQRSLTAKLGEPNRGVKQADLAVLRETYFCPAVLVEVGFLSNRRTAERMKTEDWRRRTSDALAEGVVDFLRQPEVG